MSLASIICQSPCLLINIPNFDTSISISSRLPQNVPILAQDQPETMLGVEEPKPLVQLSFGARRWPLEITLWCHQPHGWLEDPPTEWRFLARKITDFYGPCSSQPLELMTPEGKDSLDVLKHRERESGLVLKGCSVIEWSKSAISHMSFKEF